jgi:hypothetical protein
VAIAPRVLGERADDEPVGVFPPARANAAGLAAVVTGPGVAGLELLRRPAEPGLSGGSRGSRKSPYSRSKTAVDNLTVPEAKVSQAAARMISEGAYALDVSSVPAGAAQFICRRGCAA